ncbi:MAG: YceI family protein [Bacteroidales bacterium]|nr:YceI family protein [Bacteroidales bacterium]MBK7172056.1 YceI family protein [Bacteroidales bacterium]
MKKAGIITVIVLALGYLSFTVVEKSTWTYDKAHAKVGFSVTHMMISDVEGYFKNATATLTTTNPDFTDAVVELTADASSIFTDNEKRDEHLKSADFFDAQKYPTITFKSFYFKKTKTANTYYVKGNLTMHGVTKPVGLNVVAKTGVNPYSKKEIAGFKITGSLKRSDFGIGGETPSAIVSDEVQIICNAEFSKD